MQDRPDFTPGPRPSRGTMTGMTQANEINDLAEEQLQPLTCPKCGGSMEKVPLDGQSVDRCDRCKGLFFSAEAHEHMLNTPGAEAIDTGAKLDEPRDQVVRIKCPACHAQMIRMVDHHQPHIWYESCPVCFGIYMDAGEFREQKQRPIVNLIRDMLHHHERP